MPEWASLDYSTRTISGKLPTRSTSVTFLVTGTSPSGAKTTLSIPVPTFLCDIENCFTCPSTNRCSQCSDFATLYNNTCPCSIGNCAKCMISKCDECDSTYKLHRGDHCVYNGVAVFATTITAAVFLGLSLVFSVVAAVLSSTSSSNFWNFLNMIQIIEIIALTELKYPASLDQFFHGFEFLLLNVPSDMNFVSNNFVEPGRDSPFSNRFESFGFYSSYFLVQ